MSGDPFDKYEEELSNDEFARQHGFNSYEEMTEAELSAVVKESTREDERFAFIDEDEYEFFTEESLYADY